MAKVRNLKLERCSTRQEKSTDGPPPPTPERKIKKKKKTTGVERKTTMSKVKRKRKREVNNGDILNLSDLLFTNQRDHLIKYNDNQLVKAEQLADKFIVLYFVTLTQSDRIVQEKEVYLLDIYKELEPKGLFEVVFVTFGDDIPVSRNRNPLQLFQTKFSRMPWTAIPFSDSVSRKHLALRFGVSTGQDTPSAFVIDPTGMVLQRDALRFFSFGAACFPFTQKRLHRLCSRYDAILNNPSLKKLLVSPQRDYLINNKNVRVPVRDLKNKVVALYLYEDGYNNDLTAKLKEAYEELVLKNKKNFEVVLVYISNSWETYRTTEETFWKAFKTMPWLALPFKDPNCVKFQCIFDYPLELEGTSPDPSLIIIGRHGKFIELFAADVVKDFGCPAYPFTGKRAAELLAEKANKVKLEMFWVLKLSSSKTMGPLTGVFRVHISQLAGKNIMVFFEDEWFDIYPLEMRKLEEMYTQTKGTDDEFEVIHVFNSKRRSPYFEHIAALPWLTHPFVKMDSDARMVFDSVFPFGDGLLAFDHEGKVVRRAYHPIIEEDAGFPFYHGDLQMEALSDLRGVYSWDSDDDI
ncbi:hypothetical protein OROGR_029758 [Orobanche gracilis]